TLLVSHRVELNSRYTGLVTARNRLQGNFDRKAGYVKVLRSEVMTLDGKLERIQMDFDDLNQLALEKDKSQGYKDAVDGLREEVTRFVGSSVESLVRKLLSSDEFHNARGIILEVTQVLPDKHIRSVTSVPVASPIANEDANQVPLDHASNDLVASI
nr:hypothetical protein [Tanacetum cinerariifolium]